MAQILDKQGLQHYANKMCNADNRKVGTKSLPTALNEIDIAIDGFKTLFETEYGTPVNMELENNKNVFSVGTGTNVDRRSEVENSFTDVELSGNSLVNLSETKQRLNQTSAHYSDVYLCESSRLKANTSYRLEYDFECNIDFTFSKCYLGYSTSKGSMIAESSVKFDAKKGKNILNFTLTQSELDIAINNNFKYFMVRVFIDSDKKEKTYSTKNVMLLEGDYTNKPIPQYFEGMKSVGEKEDGNHKISILSNNSNLISETQKEWENKDNPRSEFIRTIDLSPIIDKYGLIEYTLTFDIKATKEGQCRVYAQNGSDSKYNIGYNDINVTTDYVRHKIKFTPTLTNPEIAMTSLAFYSTYGSGVFTTIKNIKLQIGGTSSDFVPHEFNKKEISLNEPLRGLPNGTRDTIEKINGEWKIVRRCAQVNVNGSEHWNIYQNLAGNNKVETISFASAILPIAINNEQSSRLLCNNFIGITHFNKDVEGVFVKYNNDLRFSIKRSKLVSEDVNGFKEWLSQNPTKVIYELTTPIIEDISPVTLQCWKNGTISIDEVLPVESTHTVALNKSAQIQKNIEELSILKNRIETLEKQYNNSTLNQAYELELLRLDMELDNII